MTKQELNKPLTLLTGATGFLGREIVYALLQQDPNIHLGLLVRAKDDEQAQHRVDEVLSEGGLSPETKDDFRTRVIAIRADLEQENLGLSPEKYQQVCQYTQAIIHGAASVSFSLPLDQARSINVEGTRRILDLAQRASDVQSKTSPVKVDYISTAYVAGERKGMATEQDLYVGQEFRNTYEQSKNEAERLIRERMKDLPITVYRPSIIVGDSATGRTSSFKVLYWPLKVYSRGLVFVVPAHPKTPMDIVPSDYVVSALLHIRKDQKSTGKTYHLTAGPEAPTLQQVTDLAAEFFGVRRPWFVNPSLFIRYARPLIDRYARGKMRDVLIKGRIYTPYLSLQVRFDTANTERALQGSGINVPRVQTYFQNLFQYCIDTDWGKKAGSSTSSVG